MFDAFKMHGDQVMPLFNNATKKKIVLLLR